MQLKYYSTKNVNYYFSLKFGSPCVFILEGFLITEFHFQIVVLLKFYYFKSQKMWSTTDILSINKQCTV